jgi:hypothetical protein
MNLFILKGLLKDTSMGELFRPALYLPYTVPENPMLVSNLILSSVEVLDTAPANPQNL